MAVYIITVLGSCNGGDNEKYILRKINAPDEKAENITMMYTDSGVLRARLYSPLAEHYRTKLKENPYLEMKKGMTVYFYGEDKSVPNGMLKSNYSIKYENSKKVIVRDDVVAVNVDHDTLRTEMLVWDEGKRKLYSDKYVRIFKKDGTILKGTGFESNEDFTHYRIFNTTGTIYGNDPETK